MRLYLLCLGLFEYTDLTPLLVCVLCIYIYLRMYIYIYIYTERMYICDTHVQIIYWYADTLYMVCVYSIMWVPSGMLYHLAYPIWVKIQIISYGWMSLRSPWRQRRRRSLAGGTFKSFQLVNEHDLAICRIRTYMIIVVYVHPHRIQYIYIYMYTCIHVCMCGNKHMLMACTVPMNKNRWVPIAASRQTSRPTHPHSARSTSTHRLKYTHMCAGRYTCIYTWMSIHTCTHTHAHIYIYIYIWYVYIYIYIYINTYTLIYIYIWFMDV